MDYADVKDVYRIKPDPDTGTYTQQNNAGFSETQDMQTCNMLEVKIKTEENYTEYSQNEVDYNAEPEKTPLVSGTVPQNSTEQNHSLLLESLRSQIRVGTYECPYCDWEATQPRFLRLHMRLAHNPNGEPFKCKQCSYESRDRRVLNKHMRLRHKKCNEEDIGNGSMHEASREIDEENKSEDGNETGEDRLLNNLELLDQKESDYFQCPYCSYETKTKQALTRHKQYAHKKDGELFRCEQCEYESNDKRKLTRHIRIRHRGDVLSCDSCDYQTRDKARLAAHVGAQHADLAALHVCRFCSFTTTDYVQLEDHIGTSHVERTESSLFTCEECGLQTPNASYLKSHVRAKHGGGGGVAREGSGGEECGGGGEEGGDEMLACPHCPYGTRDHDYLEQHVRAKHGQSLKPYVCDKCGYTARLKKQMNRHVRFRHDDTTTLYKCHLCQLKTKDKYYFEKHYKYLHEEVLDVHKCPECPFQSKYKQHLGRHIRLNHTTEGTVYRCERCPYTTRNKGNYTEHFKSMHDDTGKIFSCEECDYKSKKLRSLRTHVVNMHSAEPPCHRCQFCDFTSRSAKYLSQHVETKHTNPGLLYTCDHCNYSTPHKSYLGRHMRRVHRGGPLMPCAWCPYLSKNAETLRQHMRKKHTSPLLAPAETSSAASVMNRKPREKISGTAEHSCPDCPFSTPDTHLLKQHVKLLHRQTQAAKVYECAVCLFVTKTKSYLKDHYSREHEQGEQHRCPKCNFVTKNYNYYKKHMKIKHATVREVWLCAFCNIESFYKDGIKKHMMNVHKTHFDAFETENDRKSHLDMLVANALVTRQMDEETDLQSTEHDAKIDIKEDYFRGCSDGNDEKNMKDCKNENMIDSDVSSSTVNKSIDCYNNDQALSGTYIDCDQSMSSYSSIDGKESSNSHPGYRLIKNAYSPIVGNKSYREIDCIDGDSIKNYDGNNYEQSMDNKDYLQSLLVKREDKMEVDQPEYVNIGSSFQESFSVLNGLLENSEPLQVKTEVNYEDTVHG